MATVTINDVLLRDGLQDEPVLVPISERVRIAEALIAAGIRDIEAASFVNPRRVPQMAGAEELIAALHTTPAGESVRFSGLALNARGVTRALGSGVREIQLAVSASRAHSRANAGHDIEEVLAELETIVPGHPGIVFTGGISTSFVCPFEGDVPAERVVRVAKAFVAIGAKRISLADTLGTAMTDHVVRTLDAVREALPDIEIGLHLHDAQGQALTTVDAAMRMGITRFDAATGGYGGCPFAPGAHGNIATETLVRHLHAHDVSTGVDEDALDDALSTVQQALAAAKPLSGESPEA